MSGVRGVISINNLFISSGILLQGKLKVGRVAERSGESVEFNCRIEARWLRRGMLVLPLWLLNAPERDISIPTRLSLLLVRTRKYGVLIGKGCGIVIKRLCLEIEYCKANKSRRDNGKLMIFQLADA